MHRLTLLALLFLSSCYVGILDPTSTPHPTGTPWPTNTPSPTPTDDPTPTPETDCVPGSYSLIQTSTPLYDLADLKTPATMTVISEDGVSYAEPATVIAGEPVLFLFDRTPTARMIVTRHDPLRVGWVPVDALYPECR